MQAPEPSPGSRKQDILRQALKRTTPLERAAFLDGACGGDAALRVEIEALLAISIATASWTPAQAAAPASPKPSGAHPPTCSPSAESAWITTSLQSATFGCPNSRVSEHKILYLFCVGIYLRLGPDLRAHPAATTGQAA